MAILVNTKNRRKYIEPTMFGKKDFLKPGNMILRSRYCRGNRKKITRL